MICAALFALLLALPLNLCAVDDTVKEGDGAKSSKLDVAIVIDESLSMKNFTDEHRRLAMSLVNALPICGGDDKRVALALVGYAGAPHLLAPLKSGRNRTTTRKIIDQIGLIGGVTRTVDAINLALNQFKYHGRLDAMKVLVLMTDGMSGANTVAQIRNAVSRLNASGAQRFVVALNDRPDNYELYNYAANASYRVYRNPYTEKTTKKSTEKSFERLAEDVVSLLEDSTSCDSDATTTVAI